MTTSESSFDRTKLTFSQAEGLAPLPSQLRLGELSEELRSILWAYLLRELQKTSYRAIGRSYTLIGEPWYLILRDAHVFLYHKPTDEFDSYLEETMVIYKELIIKGTYNMVFDFVQFVMRHPGAPYGFFSEISRILRQCRAAYAVIDDGPTIIPIGSKEEVKVLEIAFSATKHERFHGARTHLRLAAEALTAGRYGDSVRESVHGVESTVRVLSEDSKATLAQALQKLESKLGMHLAFKKALVSLYGYSSDEAGIRHSLLEDEARVDMHDALFMLGACASFVTFLIGKGRAAGVMSRPA
jgi:hypothetical protein